MGKHAENPAVSTVTTHLEAVPRVVLNVLVSNDMPTPSLDYVVTRFNNQATCLVQGDRCRLVPTSTAL